MFPAVAVAAELAEQGDQIHFITDERGSRYLSSELSKSVFNLSVLGRRTIPRLPLAIWQMIRLTAGCLVYFIRSRPEKVIGFGGYVTYPVLLSARIFRVPYYIHEQNSVMGKVNRWLSGGATTVMTSFPHTIYANEKARMVGLPVRNEIRPIRDSLYEQPDSQFRLLILGGSQGASIFSKVVPAAFSLMPTDIRKKFLIVQQCFKEDIETVRQQYESLGINATLAPFFENIASEIAKAHLVITRSGASTVAELTTAGRPAVFVPYPAAMDDHQTSNARYVVSNQGGWLVPQQEFSPEKLVKMLTQLSQKPTVLTYAAAAIKSLGQGDATRLIADEVSCGVSTLLLPRASRLKAGETRESGKINA